MSESRGQRFRITASGTTNTYVYCRGAARRALKHGLEHERGSFYFFMMAGVFAAFTLEAFLNHVGELQVQDWKALERKLGPQEKLLLLRQVAGWSVDQGHRPFQSLHGLLRLRDALAHGKTETKHADDIIRGAPPEVVPKPQPDWMALCNAESASRLVEDAEAMVMDLWRQSGGAGDPFESSGHGSSTIGLVE